MLSYANEAKLAQKMAQIQESLNAHAKPQRGSEAVAGGDEDAVGVAGSTS
jgi:hypothetical protein